MLIMGDGIFKKNLNIIKGWITEEEEEEYDVPVDELEEDEEDVDQFTSISNTKTAKIYNLHTASPMKVVIVEPKKYEEVTTIADHLKQKKAVIVNLENLNDPSIRKSIFEFMNGAVYVLDGGIQKVSKGIFILAPNNVDIDSSIKKELESKTLFPWQSK
jgi:cell division inhibitor SepF